MAVNPIDAPISLDLKFRDAPGGTVRNRRPTLPPATAGADQQEAEPVVSEAQQLEQQESAVGPQTAAAVLNMNLKFSTDEKTGKLVVSVVDPNNGEVLRQMPSAEALKVAEQIGRYQGILVNLKV